MHHTVNRKQDVTLIGSRQQMCRAYGISFMGTFIPVACDLLFIDFIMPKLFPKILITFTVTFAHVLPAYIQPLLTRIHNHSNLDLLMTDQLQTPALPCAFLPPGIQQTTKCGMP